MPPPEPAHFPVALDLRGRRVLVVGGGSVAARKVTALLAAGADVVVVAPDVDAEIERRVDDLAALYRRVYTDHDLVGVWYVTEATGDSSVARRVAADAEAARIFCNAADQPESCTAILPAVYRVGDLTVTWSTGGRSPAMAAWLRASGPEHYGPEYSLLLELLAEERRRLRASGETRSASDWRELLDSGILEEIRSGRIERAKERLQAWQSSSSE